MSDATPLVVLVLGAVAAFGILFSLGGNDVANSIGVAAGSGAVSVPVAVAIAALMNVLGAFLAGTKVTANIAGSIINELDADNLSLVGMFLLT